MLAPDVIGETQYDGAFANCTKKTGSIFVPLFEGGDSFKTYASRIRVRSGMVRARSRMSIRSRLLSCECCFTDRDRREVV